jgi:hypothetical protein
MIFAVHVFDAIADKQHLLSDCLSRYSSSAACSLLTVTSTTPDFGGGEKQHQPLGIVGGPNRHVVAFFDAHAQKAPSDPVDFDVEFIVCFVVLHFDVLHRLVHGKLLHGFLKHLADGDISHFAHKDSP